MEPPDDRRNRRGDDLARLGSATIPTNTPANHGAKNKHSDF